MREITAEENAVETIRKIINRCCLQPNQCENTQIWLCDDIVKQLQRKEEYGNFDYPYVGCNMSAFKLKTGEIMEITYKRENWRNKWNGINVIKHVYFPDSHEYFFFGATNKDVLVIK